MPSTPTFKQPQKILAREFS
ncbi:Protein of unknown function [Pyronema omphalodes CBS 100304]|uniref:Uncharacterized protein n=1 Tax=Pyronema omphalodes (strain CBS 100304) TaxID=1076935 RepID=U4L9R4_PYROM|nr:Protein of unknown function [Pyronema omphalodes CBS 100304]